MCDGSAAPEETRPKLMHYTCEIRKILQASNGATLRHMRCVCGKPCNSSTGRLQGWPGGRSDGWFSRRPKSRQRDEDFRPLILGAAVALHRPHRV